jgi:hypothetical protein
MVNLLAIKPETADSLSVFVAWAPAAGKLKANLWYFSFFTHSWFFKFVEWRGTNIIGDFPTSIYYAKLTTAFPKLFGWLYNGRYDYTIGNDDPAHMAVYLHKMSGGSSVKNLRLVKQTLDRNSTHFHYYEYGPEENLAKYGSLTAKKVDYTRFRGKIAIMGG